MSSLPELLSPAGNEECLYAAIENGADAVYFGLAAPHNFNARGRAENFPLDKLSDTMHTLHRRGIKGCLTLNTLIQSDELPEVELLIPKIAEACIDAVIVQDLGVCRLIRAICPELPIHASTQMSLTSAESIRQASALGISRIVLPRELSIRQINDIRRNVDVELECFVHGALCISFSGQCYASLGLGGRSANRGCCAQPCRLPYSVEQNETRNKPILSPYDLAALPLLDKLIATGVHAFKIEGRLKPPEYVAEVTRIYREAIDHFAQNNNTEEVTADSQQNLSLRNLEQTFSRGLSTGWLEGTKPHPLVSGNTTSHRGVRLGTVLEVRRDAAVVKLIDSVRCGDGVVFDNPSQSEHSQGGRVYEIIRRRESVKEAEAGAKVLLTFANNSIDAQYVAENQMVWKTDDPRRQREIQKSWKTSQPCRCIALNIEVHAEVSKPIEVHITNKLGADIRLTGSDNLEPAKKYPLTQEILAEQFGRLGGTIYTLGELYAEILGNPMVPLSVLGNLRREMLESLDVFPIQRQAYTIYKEKTIKAGNVAAWSGQNESVNETQTLHVLLRDAAQFTETNLAPWLEKGCRSFYAEMRSMEEYRLAASAVRNIEAEFVAVLPRILKPGESKILQKIADLQPDAVLIRNLEELVFFRNRLPIIADFSFNVINDWAFHQLLEWGADRITFGWDLNEKQMIKLLEHVPAERVEQIIVGRIPLFTMEYCLWRTQFLRAEEPCNKLCRTQPLTIADRYGALHTVRSDIFCRNIVERSEPIEVVPRVQHIRIEWDERLRS